MNAVHTFKPVMYNIYGMLQSRPPEPELGSFHEGTAFEHSLVQYEVTKQSIYPAKPNTIITIQLEYEQWQLQASLLAEVRKQCTYLNIV